MAEWLRSELKEVLPVFIVVNTIELYHQSFCIKFLMATNASNLKESFRLNNETGNTLQPEK